MNRKKPEEMIPKPKAVWIEPVDYDEFQAVAKETGLTQRALFNKVWQYYKLARAEKQRRTKVE